MAVILMVPLAPPPLWIALTALACSAALFLVVICEWFDVSNR
jgi:hypothetical protein